MSYQTTILADSPVVYYEHEEASGTTMSDAGANSLDGSYAGSGITYEVDGPLQGEDSDAITLDGATGNGSYVSLATTNRPGYPFCLEAWVKPNSATQADVVLLLTDTDAAEQARISVGTSGNVWRFKAENAGTSDVIDSSATIDDTAFVHLFARFVSATERYLYANGVKVAGGTGQTSITWTGTNTTNYELYIGSNEAGGSFLPGTVSRSAYYNADLTPARIREHYRIGVLSDLALPMVTLKTMLSNCGSWQDEVGASTAEAARAYIETVGMSPPSSAAWLDTTPRAYAWIPSDESSSWSRIGQGVGQGMFRSASSVGLSIYRKTPAADTATIDDASVGFLAFVGQVIDELNTLISQGGTGVLLADSIRLTNWYRASTKRKNTEGDFHRADLVLDFYTGVGS